MKPTNIIFPTTVPWREQIGRLLFVLFFSVRPFVSSAWSFGFFIPATTTNDLRLWRISILGSKLLQKMLNIKSCLAFVSYTIMVYGHAFHLWSLRFDILQQRCSLSSFHSSLIVKQAIHSLCKSHSNCCSSCVMVKWSLSKQGRCFLFFSFLNHERKHHCLNESFV